MPPGIQEQANTPRLKLHLYQNARKEFECSVIVGNQCLKMEESSNEKR